MPEETRISTSGSVVTVTTPPKPWWLVHTEGSPRSRTSQIRVALDLKAAAPSRRRSAGPGATTATIGRGVVQWAAS